MALGLYIHIPFCLSKCAYCDFVSYPDLLALLPAYVGALRAEYEMYGDLLAGACADTVYLGGGTPSLLPADLLADVLDLCRSASGAAAFEITMEANPGTMDPAKLEAFVRGGGTRLSLGLQTHDACLLRLLGRRHTAAEAAGAVADARRAGVTRINLDLIYGLPGQTAASWRATLDFALSLGPDHLSLYDLELHPGTPLARRIAIGDLARPAEDDTAAMLREAMRILPAAGFLQYEVASFARPGAECRHNLNYWRNGGYLGLGAAAHSHLWGRRWANLADPRAYLAAVAAGNPPVAAAEELGPDADLLETVMLGLRLREGLDLAVLSGKAGLLGGALFGQALPRLASAGLIELTARGERLRLTERGVLLADYVLRSLAAELPQAPRPLDKAPGPCYF
ncbi:MAG: radical SAM family heme chaperone HemW [Patescibacteria group bacterium]